MSRPRTSPAGDPGARGAAGPADDTAGDGAAGLAGDTAGDGADETADDVLVARALAAQTRAYAPYSGYPVGAALIADGRVIDGANVENASFGLTLCAERVAAAAAAAAGLRAIERIAVATPSSPPVAPCGMCLQTLIEFCAEPARLRVLLVNPAGERRDITLAELLPHGFTRRQLDAVSGARTGARGGGG